MGSGQLTPAREGYDFLAGADPYSDGVVAQTGYEIVQARFGVHPPWQEGFRAIAQFLEQRGRPIGAVCGVELRSPTPVGFDGFADFNNVYHETLGALGLLVDGRNPIARTNVVPMSSTPVEIVMYGFTFTIESTGSRPTFVTAGAGELREDALSDEAIVAPGDTSPGGMREKATHVLATMSSRLLRLGVDWRAATGIGVYTAEDPGSVADLVLDTVGTAAQYGLHWFPSRPPVTGLDFEMDVRGIRRSIVVEELDA